MEPGQASNRIIKLVEEKTGLPVHVDPDPNLPGTTLASVKMARGRTPLHQVAYQPNAATSPDYLIVFQCAFILRLYACEPDNRFDLTSAPGAETAIRPMVRAHPPCEGMPSDAVERYVTFLRDTILMQLRSIPTGLRVDDWIRKEFPELAELQQQAMRRQLQDGLATLEPKTRTSVPETIFDHSARMNAAQAAFWADRLQRPEFVVAYRSTGFLDRGQELLKMFTNLPDAPASDRDLVDTWAKALGVSDWYQWQPYSVG
jgi:hypothetical protein